MNKKATTEKPVMELLKELVVLTEDSGTILSATSRRAAVAVQKRLNLDTPLQAVLLSAFVDMFDDKHISPHDLARHFGIRNIEILSLLGELQYFIDRGHITCGHNNDGNVYYALDCGMLKALSKNRLPEPRKITQLNIDEFIEYTLELIDMVKENRGDSDYIDKLREAVNSNTQIPLAAKLKSMDLENPDLVFFFALINENINNHFYSIGMHELTNYVRPRYARMLIDTLVEGESILVKEEMVEPFCNNGQADMGEWTFTKACCEAYMKDVPVVIRKKDKENRENLLHHEDITAKELFYSETVQRSVNQLEELLEEKRMNQVMEHLGKKGMRKCFTCIFYGGPGTGKTETVLQLARRTGRDIMMVDISSIRDKWVGETEKSIKRIFDRYRLLAKDNSLAPILCFNEADALIGKRNSGDMAVDKMENAMIDIILNEMESLEGIMIATSNLAGNMDSAVERRFLYKVEFERPSALARKAIWMSMLPEVDDEIAMQLADRFDFNGGEIENVTRKYTIDSIIHCKDEVDEGLLVELCQDERYTKSKNTNVGFKVG